MIPLSAREAADLLRHSAREIAQCERQAAHFARLAANEQARLERLRAERAELEAQAGRLSLTAEPRP